MSPRKGHATSKSRKKSRTAFRVGQRVELDGYGPATVIAVEARRGGRYSDLWVRPDDNPAQEIGVGYQHDLVEPT